MPTKLCRRCSIVKDLSKFYMKSNTTYCKSCIQVINNDYLARNKAKVLAYRDRWRKEDRKNNPAKYLPKDRARTLRKFGESPEWYDIKMKEQRGVCALCDTVSSHKHQCGKVASLAIDHDHETGKARGLLCMVCNHALHKIDKDRAWATRAVAYLERYK